VDTQIRPEESTDANTFQDKRAKFSIDSINFDEFTEIEYAVAPATNVTITLYFGPNMSSSKQLAAKRKRTPVALAPRVGSPSRPIQIGR
jgi:hypothetical protein